MLETTIETTERSLTWVRWSTLIILLFLSLVERISDRAGVPNWLLILIFSIYNAGMEMLREHVPMFHHFRRAALLDLPLVAVLYFFAPLQNGPIFVLYLLSVFCAATTMPFRSALQFTVAAGATLIGIAILHPLRIAAQFDLSVLITQIALVLFWGVSVALLKQQVLQSRDTAMRSTREVLRLTTQGEARLRFIASVAHELRTPLTASQAGLGMLTISAADRLRPEELHLLENAQRNIERLRILTDDLLAFNMIESGAFRLKMQTVDISALLRSSVESLKPLFSDKAQSVTLEIPPTLLYHGNAQRLEQTFTNILANANKHTPDGTEILVRATKHPAEIRIAIRDNGPGIAPDELEIIFQRFHHGATKNAGSGLGLAIARSIVALHGGTIWAENHPDGGTLFLISLKTEGNG